MFIDYHMHSDFSADCKTPMEETIQTAIKKGLSEICFTEHVDEDYPDTSIVFELDLPRYAKAIKDMQEKYRGQITIKKGIEIGVQPHLLDNCETLVKQNEFDFVICSMHTADKKDLHSGNFFADRTASEAYQIYYEELLYCVQHFSAYNILGHIDLVKRYQTLDTNENFHDILEQIFKVIIAQGKGIEVNTSGYHYGLDHAMPSEDILRLYKDCGGEIITLGSDAHHADHVGRHFETFSALLSEIGFQYICSFDDRKPIFHPIQQFL